MRSPSKKTTRKNRSLDTGRRGFIKGTASAVVAAIATPSLGVVAAEKKPAARPESVTAIENRKEGTRDWQLTRVRLDRANGFRSPSIEGYCSRQSVPAGESLDIIVSTTPAARFNIEVFRMGYYGGRGARLMKTIGPLQGKAQPLPPIGPNRVRECKWEPATSLKIPSDWPSGVYLGRLTTVAEKDATPYWQSYVVFIVRDDRPAQVLFQCSDNTWQAYNRWPDRFSLYDDGTERDWTSGPGIDVSFDRPFGKYRQIYENPQSVGSGEFLCWEYPMAYWLEQHGYDVSYCSQSDMISPERGRKSRVFVSIGHDEYWDVRAYDNVKGLIDQGVNALFLSGNTLCWVSPFTPSSDGRPNRIITRAGPFGGYTDHRPENGRVFPVRGPDEGLVMGGRNITPVNGGGDWICVNPGHWIFKGTEMKKGDTIPGLVGWEYHGNPANLPGLEIVAEGTAWVGGQRPQHWTATVHPGPKKNFVFNAATIFWAQGLSSPPGHMLPWSHWSRPHGPDHRVQRITRNLLDRGLV
jgi:hypothetical protein